RSSKRDSVNDLENQYIIFLWFKVSIFFTVFILFNLVLFFMTNSDSLSCNFPSAWGSANLATKASRIKLTCLVKSFFVRFFILEINSDSGLFDTWDTTSSPQYISVPLKLTEK